MRLQERKGEQANEHPGRRRGARLDGRRAVRRVLGVPFLGLCLSVAVGIPAPSAAPGDEGRARGVERPARAFSADVAVRWARLLYDRIRFEKLSPPVASRIIGYAEVALYEAVVPGMPDHRSLGGQLNDLPSLPSIDPHAAYYWPEVANAALGAALRGHFASAATLSTIDALEEELAQTYRQAVPAKTFERSRAQGQAVAAAVLAWASTDGFATFNNCSFTPPTGPGLWVPTPPAFRPPLQPCWGQLRPFALRAPDACAPPAPTEFSSDPGSDFYGEALEVRDTVNGLSSEQRETALYWSDDPGNTGTPPGHSLSIAAEVVEQRALSLDVASEAFARVGIAVADAFISCWQTKYVYNLLRPVTYIQTVIGDVGWMPILVTPAFPEYTSGHSVQSGAIAQVLTDQLGPLPFIDTTESFQGFAPRSFADFFAAAGQAAISRLYGGIHYRPAIDRGLDQGVCVGRSLAERVRFRSDEDAD